MQKFFAAALGAAVALPAPLLAEVTGAQVGVQYSGYADADSRDMHKTSLGGSLEYAITPQFSIQGDVAQRYYGVASWKGTTGTVHATYHTYDGAAVGLYGGRDWISGKDSNYYGLEGAQTFGQIRVEAFGGYVTGEQANKGGALGLSGAYSLNDAMTVGAEYSQLTNDDDLKRLGVTGTYAFPAGYAIDGEIGMADREGDDKEAFVSLGLRATFGGQNGVTFGGRGLQAIYPGR